MLPKTKDHPASPTARRGTDDTYRSDVLGALRAAQSPPQPLSQAPHSNALTPVLTSSLVVDVCTPPEGTGLEKIAQPRSASIPLRVLAVHVSLTPALGVSLYLGTSVYRLLYDKPSTREKRYLISPQHLAKIIDRVLMSF